VDQRYGDVCLLYIFMKIVDVVTKFGSNDDVEASWTVSNIRVRPLREIHNYIPMLDILGTPKEPTMATATTDLP